LHRLLPPLESFKSKELAEEGHLIQHHLLNTFLDVGLFGYDLGLLNLIWSHSDEASLCENNLTAMDFLQVFSIFEIDTSKLLLTLEL
jgi:hypothetical protein